LSEIKSAFLADIPGGASRRFKGVVKRRKINNFRYRGIDPDQKRPIVLQRTDRPGARNCGTMI
jgi:hypothetical protein